MGQRTSTWAQQSLKLNYNLEHENTFSNMIALYLFNIYLPPQTLNQHCLSGLFTKIYIMWSTISAHREFTRKHIK